MKRTKFFLLSVIFLYANTCYALKAGPYLDVPYWQSCVYEVMLAYQEVTICLPRAKPDICPMTSWSKLTRFNLVTWCRNL